MKKHVSTWAKRAMNVISKLQGNSDTKGNPVDIKKVGNLENGI